ncbi:MFS transporter [Vineibacter terrae]|uniref:MFS transporter n=1 Tax=Vineibacter terrae TaxID=2586908 RepID=A0A5C8PKZ5_9HYPH|nr:MFS transporter [Vineibacter terrae]TXL74093.1 MFS transporter [Vineibacter terrae]
MFEVLDRQTHLSANQKKIVVAAIIGGALEFFDYFLIGFVLAFIIGPWQLTYGQSAVILLSSGIGAMLGAAIWGWVADKIGRRKVFIATVLNFSLATGLLYFTPDNGWVYLTVMRFFVGFGVGGLYCVDLPLVQEFVPSSKRGFVSGLVTVFIPIGVGIGALMAGYLTPRIGWQGLFAIGVLPAFLTLLVRIWVPESPRWLARMGRYEEARASLAWALQVEPRTLPLPTARDAGERQTSWLELFQHPRSLVVSWLGNLGAQTGVYGVTLWAPTLFVALLKIPPTEAAKMVFAITVGGMIGRICFSYFSERLGRRVSGGLLGFGAAAMLVLAGVFHDAFLAGISVYWLLLIVAAFFADGGFAVVGPYAAEVWPAHLRTSGMGSAYGFGGIGKIIGPLGLALIIGASDVLKPGAPVANIVPAFIYLGSWFAMAGAVYLFLGIETKGRSIEDIDRSLTAPTPLRAGVGEGVEAGRIQR